MEYKVQVYQVEGKENLLGFANLVLEEQFVLNGFAIKEFRNGKVYLRAAPGIRAIRIHKIIWIILRLETGNFGKNLLKLL